MKADELEFRLSELYQSVDPARFSISDASIADIDVRVEHMNGATILANRTQLGDKDLVLDLAKNRPLITMFFQIKNRSVYLHDGEIIIPEMHHSLNYLPECKSKYRVEHNTQAQNLCIRIEPEVFLNSWLDVEADEEWYRFIEKHEPFMTLHQSAPMNSHITDLVNQLLNCPFTGQMGIYFKLSLIKLLFVHQMGVFMKMNTRSAEPQKLTKRDIDALYDLKKHLEVNYLQDLSLDCLVKKSGLNLFKLKYGFKALFDTSVMRFIDDKKMLYAKQLLLAEKNLERFELADQLGYNHYSNFSAAFKKRFGYSPAQMRDLNFK